MLTALAVVALGAGALLATGALSFAQTDEPSATPSPTEDAGDEASPSPSPSDEDTGGDEDDANDPEDDADPGGDDEEGSEGDDDDVRRCGGAGKYLIKEAAAEVLGISEEQLIEGLRDGQSLAQIAEAQGRSVDEFRSALLENVTADLQARLDAGEITQEQFDDKVSQLEANIDEIINAEGGLRFHRFRGEPGEEEAEGGGARFRPAPLPNFDA
jgi:hypothetical protein